MADPLPARCAQILGAPLRSLVLHTSLANGGLRPGRSDIDLLAVVGGGISDAQAAALEDLVRRSDLGRAAGVDLHVAGGP